MTDNTDRQDRQTDRQREREREREGGGGWGARERMRMTESPKVMMEKVVPVFSTNQYLEGE